MSLPSDFAIVDLPAELARRCGADRVLVEAVEMHGAAILVGVARDWVVLGANYNVPPSAWLDVPLIDVPIFERLFVETRKQAHGPDYHDARHAWRNAKPASEPLKPCAPVRYMPGRRTT